MFLPSLSRVGGWGRLYVEGSLPPLLEGSHTFRVRCSCSVLPCSRIRPFRDRTHNPTSKVSCLKGDVDTHLPSFHPSSTPSLKPFRDHPVSRPSLLFTCFPSVSLTLSVAYPSSIGSFIYRLIGSQSFHSCFHTLIYLSVYRTYKSDFHLIVCRPVS